MEERSKTFSADENVSACQKGLAVPKNTRKHTSWRINVYKEWTRSRAMKRWKILVLKMLKYPEAPDDRLSPTVDEINYWLSKFCIDVKQK